MNTYEKPLPPFKTFFPTVLMLATSGYITSNIYLPSLSNMRALFNTSTMVMQLSLTVYLLAFSFSQLFYGPASDRFGRKKVALLALVFSLVGTMMCLFSYHIAFFMLGRILQGVALGAGSALYRAIVRDVYHGDLLVKIGAFVPISTAALAAAVPLIGGYFEDYLGWRYTFVFILVYTIVAFFMVLFWLEETHANYDKLALNPKVFCKNYWHLISSPIFIGYASCSSFSFGGILAYFAATTILFQEILHLSPIAYGWLAVLVGIVMVLGGFFNTFLLKRIGRHRGLVFGVFVMIAGGMLMLIPWFFGYLTVLSVLFPMFVFAFGGSITFANAFGGALAPFAHIAGFAGALYGCYQLLGASVATGIIALIPETTQLPLSLLLIAIGVLSYILQLVAFKATIHHRHHHD